MTNERKGIWSRMNGIAAIAGVLVVLFTSCGDRDGTPVAVTFTEHVAPILYNNCSICHRPGGSAHFSLISYEEARKNAGASAYVA